MIHLYASMAISYHKYNAQMTSVSFNFLLKK